MKKILAILVLTSGWQAVAADEPKSAEAQKDQCNARLDQREDVNGLRDDDRCYAYMRGVQEEMAGEPAWADGDAHTRLVIGNWQDGLSTDQLIRVFVKYVNDNPAELNKPANAVIRRSAEASELYSYSAAPVALCALEGQAQRSNVSWPKDKGEYIAASSESIPTFPRTLSGYRSENDKDFWNKPFPSRGTVRIFQGNEWQGLPKFPNTMNGCSSGVFMIRWRLSDANVLVQSSVRYSKDVPAEMKAGSLGYMSGTNCQQPMFKFEGTRSGDKSTLVDVYYELKFWQAAP